MNTAAQMRLDAPLVVLAAAMRLQFADDPAAQRAIDGAIAYLRTDLPHEFDGVELRVTSYSRAGEGAIQSTDGESCTCARAPRLVLAQSGLQAAACTDEHVYTRRTSHDDLARERLR